jgi:MFS family permease
VGLAATMLLRGVLRGRLVDGLTMFIVTGLSLCLLLYVSYGDSKRTYEQIHIEKITAHGLLLQSSIEKFLRDGLPLKQYAGFATLATPMLEGEDLDAATVYDHAGRQVFGVVDKSGPKLPDPPEVIKDIKRDIEIAYGPTHYQLVVPLRTRFETVGTLVMVSPTSVVSKRLRVEFQPLIYAAIGLSAIFALILVLVLPYFERSRVPWLQIGYGVTFLIMSALVIGTLVGLYYDGVQDKSKASAVTLSQRMGDIVAFKLHFNDFDGLGRTFSEFRRVNAEINEAALIEDGSVRIATDPTRLGRTWVSDQRNFEYKIGLSRADEQRRVDLAVTVPRDVVFERVLRSVKNFAALFVASAFLAGLFLQVASSLQGHKADRQAGATAPQQSAGDAALIIVKPVFFLAVFLDSLTYAFLPKFMQEAATAEGISVASAARPFTAYYLCFALSLLPAGNLADRYGPKPLILSGMLLAGAAVAGMIVPLGLNELTILRGLAGIGQGMLLIGVQSYILAVASPEKKTQGAAIIVFGFQGGMISGMALGSLLVTQLQPQGVFAIAGAVAVATILYSLLLLPRAEQKPQAAGGLGAAVRKLGGDIKNVATNLEFLRTLLCIGIPAKAILTGTITFALPLLLGQYGYRSEDIGQIIMLYGLGVIAASGYASRLVDRTKNSEQVLFWGAVMSGSGLVLIGLMGGSLVGNGALSTAVVIGGVILVGIAHGFINAPVVTHVAQSTLAKRVGANPVTTSYRFLERAGHIAGPFLLAQLFLLWGQEAQVVAWIGIATAAMGLLFVAHSRRQRVPSAAPEPVR